MDEIVWPEKVERHFRCRFYQACLDKAAALDWISFSCGHCPLFSHGEQTPYHEEPEEEQDEETPIDI